MDTISIHILQWNQSSSTIRCIQRLIPQANLRISILDNGSDPTELENLLLYLEAQAENRNIAARVTVYSCAKNLGFSEGHRYLLTQEDYKASSAIVLLNNDAELAISTLNNCVKWLKGQENLACVVPVEQKDGHRVNSCFRYFPIISRYKRIEIWEDKFGQPISGSKWIYPDGSCLIIDPKSIEPQYFDIPAFCYFEELILTEHWRKNNLAWAVYEQGTFAHFGGLSTHDSDHASGRILRFYNEIWSASWYTGRTFGLLGMPIVLLRNLVRTVRLLFSNRRGEIKLVWRASISALSGKTNPYKVKNYLVDRKWSINSENTI